MLGVLIFLVLVAAASFYFYSQARKTEKEKDDNPFDEHRQLESDDSGERNVHNIQLGDIVTHFGTDYVVEGRLDYNDSGWTWTTYMLVDGEDVRWLAVEVDDQLEVSMWDEVDLHISGDRPSEFLEWEGEKFSMVESGSADVTQQGKTGKKTGLSMEYFEYEGEGDRYLSVEKWGGEIEVSIGEDVNPYSLEIFPGS